MPFPITNVMSSYSSVDYRNSVRVEGSGKLQNLLMKVVHLGLLVDFIL